MFNKIKKFLVFILIIPMLFCFTACGKNKNSNNIPNNQQSQTQTGNGNGTENENQGGGDNEGGSENQGNGNENQGGSEEGNGNENQGGGNNEGEDDSQGGTGSGDEGNGDGSGDDNQGGDTQQPVHVTITIDNFIEDLEILNSELSNFYKTTITLTQGTSIKVSEQLVNVSKSTNQNKEITTLYSSLKNGDNITAYLKQDVIKDGSFTTTNGIVIDDVNKKYYYTEDFNAINPNELQSYLTYEIYQNMLDAISPLECFYFFDGSFLTKFNTAYFYYIQKEDCVSITKKDLSTQDNVSAEYKINIKVSETETHSYTLNYDGGKLKSINILKTTSENSKNIYIENVSSNNTVVMPDYSSVEYSQEILEFIQE